MRDTNNVQVLIVEYGFLDNANDALRLQKYWDKYAEAVVKAVSEYAGFPYREPESGKITYIVRAGDTLWSIASRFNTTVEEIKRLNGLTSNSLSIGQQLFIPGTETTPTPPSGNIVYIVKAGDTLWSIANRFNTTVAEIRQLNNLTSDSLSIGQQLFISGVSIEKPETSPTIHTVVAGDTLWSIASRFNTTVQSIKTWNNLTNDIIEIGQRLIVRQGTLNYSLYTVVAGDTLWSIAGRFNTTVAELKKINNLTTDALSIGQQLLVPMSSSRDYNSYTVSPGESLWSIAGKLGITVDGLKKVNNLLTNILFDGQKLKVSKDE